MNVKFRSQIADNNPGNYEIGMNESGAMNSESEGHSKPEVQSPDNLPSEIAPANPAEVTPAGSELQDITVEHDWIRISDLFRVKGYRSIVLTNLQGLVRPARPAKCLIVRRGEFVYGLDNGLSVDAACKRAEGSHLARNQYLGAESRFVVIRGHSSMRTATTLGSWRSNFKHIDIGPRSAGAVLERDGEISKHGDLQSSVTAASRPWKNSFQGLGGKGGKILLCQSCVQLPMNCE